MDIRRIASHTATPINGLPLFAKRTRSARRGERSSREADPRVCRADREVLFMVISLLPLATVFFYIHIYVLLE